MDLAPMNLEIDTVEGGDTSEIFGNAPRLNGIRMIRFGHSSPDTPSTAQLIS